jgi:hypothetical protein
MIFVPESTKQAWKSYNIKLLLMSKHDTLDSVLQHALLTILETIEQEMGTDVNFFLWNETTSGRFSSSISYDNSIQISSQSQ